MTAQFYNGSSPEFQDTAFEPHSGYMFEDASGIDQLHYSMDAPYDGNIGIDSGHIGKSAPMAWGYVLYGAAHHRSMTDFRGSRDQMDMSNNGHPQSFPLDFPQLQRLPFNRGADEVSPITPSWQASDTSSSQLHTAAVANRNNGVTRLYGQVTPVTSQSRSPASVAEDAQQQQMAQSNAKSERARNAANHRHSQTKQARDMLRKDRKGSVGRSEGGDEEKPRNSDKQEYREKNRQAAAKCRKKKKDSTEILENTARAVKEQNTLLRNMERQLRDEYSALRTKALAHDGTESCRCTAIHQYNAGQAQHAAAARGHVGSPPVAMPDMQAMQAFQAFQAMSSIQSPAEGNMATPEMPAMSLGMPSSRTQSLSSGSRSEMGMQQVPHARVDSTQDPVMQLGDQDFVFDQSFGPRIEGLHENGQNDDFH